jgi:ABC-2 type transport system ATP-binding protein
MYGIREAGAAEAALSLVDLTPRAETLVSQLSGGLRRRLSLACALVHRPPVLFLDEPTVGVDPALRAQFWAHFHELARAGTTIVVSSHVMDEADRCDELLFMRAGRVIAQGTGDDLRGRAGTRDLEQAFLRFSNDREPVA